MRRSDKIILTFLLLGIIIPGSYIGWRYFQNSNNTAEKPAGMASSDNALVSKYSRLEVSANPFYEPTAGKKEANKLSLPPKSPETVNKPVANENINRAQENVAQEVNTNKSPNSRYVPAAVKNDNINKNANKNVNTAVASENNVLLSFAVVGDTQGFDANSADDSLKQAAASIAKSNPDLVMTVGDLVSSCEDSNKCKTKYDNWKKLINPLYSKTKETVGNHDRSGKEAADKIWQDVFDLPTNGPEGFSELVYSFDFQNSHFVVLDSEKPEEHLINKTQRDWLEKDLAANTKENTFVFFHEPAYPVSSKIGESLDAKKSDRDALWDILKNHNVTAVFNGHEHIMSRRKVEGLYQFVIGNTDIYDHDAPKAGLTEYFYRGHHYAIVSVKGREVTVKIFKVDGTELNSFTLP